MSADGRPPGDRGNAVLEHPTPPASHDGTEALPATSGRSRRRSLGPTATVWPAVGSAALAALAGVWAADGIGLSTVVGLLAGLAVLTAAGAAVWMLLLPSARPLQAVVLGCPLGLGLVALGVVLSGATGVFAVRWLPVALGLLTWVPVLRRERRTVRRAGPSIGWGLWGAVVAQVALVLALRPHLATFADDAGGWRANYVDIPWHIAFTAEALERAPQVYPWVPDVSLGYSWLFSAALGGWGSATTVTAADLVVRIAPALFTVLLPLLVAGTAWTVSRSRTATFLAPVLLTFAQGPLFIFRDTMDITPIWLIPNRDFSNAFVLMTVIALAAAGREPRHRWSVTRSAALLALLSFTASASKGSALPALLGAAGILVLFALLTRRPVVPALVRLIAVGVGMVAAQYTVTRSLSYLRVDPLTFLGGQTPPGLGTPLALLTVLLLLGTVAFVLVTALLDPPTTAPALPLAGGAIGGIAAVTLFGHPGLSQLYFLHAAWPLLCAGVAVALAHWARVVGPATLVAFAGAAVSFALVLAPPPEGGVRPWAVAALVVLATVTAAVSVPVLARIGRRAGPPLHRPVLACAAAVLSASFVVQNWGVPSIALPAARASTEADMAAVDESTRAAYEALAAASDPGDLVMTNKHCQSGHVATGDCDPRWFGISAFAERRVLIEGWSYTRLSEGVAVEDVYWQPELLARNDAFLADPDAESCRFFVDQGVDWILVDKREAWSERLAEVAEPLVDRGSVAVYRLTPDCGTG